MKRTILKEIPSCIPNKFLPLIYGADIYDSSCSPEARVYYIDRDGGYYLKRAALGTLSAEAEMTRYFHNIGIGVEVIDYVSEVSDWMLSRKAAGEDCTYHRYLDDPRRLSAYLGELLRELHERSYSGCPAQNRTDIYKATVEDNYRTDNYDKSQFPDSFGYRSADEAYRVFWDGREGLGSDTLIHGDYCLPNIMLDDWKLSAFIDVGNGGVGDRHIDLFWGVWTLWFNLRTEKYTDRFLDAYGMDLVEREMLRVVAAAEVFG